MGLLQCSILIGQLHCLNFTAQDGLPSENVLCAAEDQDEFMWFGTSAGVCQFDGLNFKDFSTIGSGDLPGGVFVTALEIDEQNNLWVGTEKQGIYYFNRQSQIWQNFSKGKSGFFTLESNEVFDIHSTSDGLIWYGVSNGGLGCIDLKEESNLNYDMHLLPRRNTWKNRLIDIIEAPHDSTKFYVAAQGYVYTFDRLSRSFEMLPVNAEPNVPAGYTFTPQTIAVGESGDIWIGSWNCGVKSFNIKDGAFRDRYPVENPLLINWRSNVYQGKANEIWIADRQQGIGRYDLESDKFEFYQSEPYNRNGLLKGDYNAIYHSSQDHTWVLTSQGISLIVQDFQAFSYFQDDVKGTNFFLDIDPLPGTNRYIGSFAGEHAPLKVLDANLLIVARAHVHLPNSAFQSIFETVIFRNKILCLANRVLEYLPAENRLIPFDLPGFNQTTGISDMQVSGDNLILLFGNGTVVVYNEVDGIKEYHLQGYGNPNPEQVIFYRLSSFEDQIWVATKAELVKVDRTNCELKYFMIRDKELVERTQDDELAEGMARIKQIVPIGNERLWVVTEGEGLFLVSKQSGQFQIQTYRDKSHLDQLQSPVEMIHGNQNDFWLATMNGLVHTDAGLDSFQVFGQNEGLLNRKLSQGLERIGDHLYIGMPKGFARANTRDLIISKKVGKAVISQVEIGGLDVTCDSIMKFRHWENQAHFHVASPNYQDARSVTYGSRLINHIDEWQYSGAYERTFRYENLSPGKYRFELKARSPRTLWSEVQSFEFMIRPPFWKTGWFRFIVFALLAGLAYLIYQIKLRRDLKEERIKTRLASLESQALRAQMNPHFIFNSLNSIKSLILLDRKQEGVTYLTKFSRMVREILTYSKEKTIPLDKELELLRIYLDMESLRFHQKFDYKIDVDPSVNLYHQKVPPLLIQPYVENSIWHGLLHKEGDAHLAISVAKRDDYLLVTVEDNGIGRKASALAKANKPVYKKSSEGLKLSKNRIDLISEFADVEIEDLYQNQVASGTRVTIKLPANYGKEV